MPRCSPDPAFYLSPRVAMEAPRETLAFVAMVSPSEETGSGP
jgi:hypothetical protein